jgi:acetyltransferase-like isoleucine patch superfamily enzyme
MNVNSVMAILFRKFRSAWIRGWLRFAGQGRLGRLACRFAGWFAPPFFDRLPYVGDRGFIAPSASLHHPGLRVGRRVFIDDRVMIFREKGGGNVELGDNSALFRDCTILTGAGGSVSIGARSMLQPRCQLSAYAERIAIGNDVGIAPNCAFYPYNHGTDLDMPIQGQPLASTGPITIEDGAWLGFGVIVLSGVRGGKGAVVGAGSVVLSDVPDNAIAMGNPARVVSYRTRASLETVAL